MKNSAFTLIELMIIVSILGILAAIVLPTVSNARQEAAVAATVTHLRSIEKAIQLYYQDHGEYPPEASWGQMPAGLESYLPPDAFSTTPAAGGWTLDYARNHLPGSIVIRLVTSSISKTLEEWQRIDEHIDDGDLDSGHVFRDGGNLLILIAEE